MRCSKAGSAPARSNGSGSTRAGRLSAASARRSRETSLSRTGPLGRGELDANLTAVNLQVELEFGYPGIVPVLPGVTGVLGVARENEIHDAHQLKRLGALLVDDAHFRQLHHDAGGQN